MKNSTRVQSKVIPSWLNEINTTVVLHEVRQNGPVSRVELWKRTGLSKPTVYKIVDTLVSRKLLEPAGEGNGSALGGKPSLLYRFNTQAGFLLVFVLHETSVEGAVGDCAARFQKRFSFPITRESPPDEVLNQVIRRFRRILSSTPAYRDRLLGIGISLPGVADLQCGKAVYVPGLPAWDNLDICAPFEAAFQVDTWVENESRLKAVAEHWFGAAQGVDDFASISIGDGTGSGIYLRGSLWRGANHLAGEVGHMPLALLDSGQPQQMEVINSRIATWAFLDRATQAAQENPASALAKEWHRTGKVQIPKIFELAELGDEVCSQLVDELGFWLGLLIGNVLLHYDMPLLVLHGPYRSGGDRLLDIVRKTLGNHFLPHMVDHTVIRFSEISKDIDQIGAASLVLQQIFALNLEIK
jgi:predicted NBD/HSP70 family sugar kinase